MNLQEYINENLNKTVDTDGVYGHQCVDMAKDYSNKVLGVTLGTFGGSALTGWYNKSNTFSEELFEKVVNDKTKPNQVPLSGDIIFFSGPTKWGHVGVVVEANQGENKITVLDQNTGSGDGLGNDDRIRINTYSYGLVLGWYSAVKESNDFSVSYSVEKQQEIKDQYEIDSHYNGVPVMLSKETRGNVNASYLWDSKMIVLYPLFFTHEKEKRDAILYHEYAHHILVNVSSIAVKKLWLKIHKGDKTIMDKINSITGKDYNYNAFVTPYAATNLYEDHAECVEEGFLYPEKKYNSYADVKVIIANAIMKMYK